MISLIQQENKWWLMDLKSSFERNHFRFFFNIHVKREKIEIH
jgi:hypothetical protein